MGTEAAVMKITSQKQFLAEFRKKIDSERLTFELQSDSLSGGRLRDSNRRCPVCTVLGDGISYPWSTNQVLGEPLDSDLIDKVVVVADNTTNHRHYSPWLRNRLLQMARAANKKYGAGSVLR